MKRFYSLLCAMACLSASHNALSQFNFSVPETHLCADGVTEVEAYQYWEAYQTLDGTYYGEVDPAHCVNLGIEPFTAIISEADIDITKPVFIHWQGAAPVQLSANWLYNITFYNTSQGLDLYSIDYCDDGVCQGFIAKTRVPDDPSDADTELEVRIYTQEFGPSEMMGMEIAPMCVASEYFLDVNEITDLYYKLQFEPGFETYFINDGYLEGVWDVSELDNQSLTWYQGAPGQYFFYNSNLLVKHDEASFPNLENITYLEASPIPNAPEVTEVLLTLESQATLTFQPFTAVRGGFIEGSTEQRHSVVLVNNGGEFCLNSFFELVFNPQNSLVYNSGKMNMAWGSCMRFEPESTLQVGPNAELYYGEQGMGMLAMQSGSKIVLEEGASIVLDNALRLFNADWQTEIENIHIYLNEGNSLVFGPYSMINNISNGEQMKLVVHLNGGFVDIANLDAESLKHLEFVYAEQNQSIALLAMLGNPVSDALNFQMHTQQQGNSSVKMIDGMGRVAAEYNMALAQGFNQLQLDVQHLPAGAYTMQVQVGNEQFSTRWVKLNN